MKGRVNEMSLAVATRYRLESRKKRVSEPAPREMIWQVGPSVEVEA